MYLDALMSQTFVCLCMSAIPLLVSSQTTDPQKKMTKKKGLCMFAITLFVRRQTKKKMTKKKSVNVYYLSVCQQPDDRQKKKSYTLGGLKILVNEASSY